MITDLVFHNIKKTNFSYSALRYLIKEVLANKYQSLKIDTELSPGYKITK